jgi:hypothetical protein
MLTKKSEKFFLMAVGSKKICQKPNFIIPLSNIKTTTNGQDTCDRLWRCEDGSCGDGSEQDYSVAVGDRADHSADTLFKGLHSQKQG